MFPTVPHNEAVYGGGGNRTRDGFPYELRNGAKFHVIQRGDVRDRCSHSLPFHEADVLCAWEDQNRWWKELPFALCDDCLVELTETGWVYFVRAGDSVKIGYSRDPDRRIKDLAVGSPVPLELWHRIPGTEYHERQLHALFAAERTHGEWFRVSERIQAFVDGKRPCPDCGKPGCPGCEVA